MKTWKQAWRVLNPHVMKRIGLLRAKVSTATDKIKKELSKDHPIIRAYEEIAATRKKDRAALDGYLGIVDFFVSVKTIRPPKIPGFFVPDFHDQGGSKRRDLVEYVQLWYYKEHGLHEKYHDKYAELHTVSVDLQALFGGDEDFIVALLEIDESQQRIFSENWNNTGDAIAAYTERLFAVTSFLGGMKEIKFSDAADILVSMKKSDPVLLDDYYRIKSGFQRRMGNPRRVEVYLDVVHNLAKTPEVVEKKTYVFHGQRKKNKRNSHKDRITYMTDKSETALWAINHNGKGTCVSHMASMCKKQPEASIVV